MKIASVAQVKSQFSAFLKSSAGGPVVVTRNGKPVAVLVGVGRGRDRAAADGLFASIACHPRPVPSADCRG